MFGLAQRCAVGPSPARRGAEHSQERPLVGTHPRGTAGLPPKVVDRASSPVPLDDGRAHVRRPRDPGVLPSSFPTVSWPQAQVSGGARPKRRQRLGEVQQPIELRPLLGCAKARTRPSTARGMTSARTRSSCSASSIALPFESTYQRRFATEPSPATTPSHRSSSLPVSLPCANTDETR